jgi:hypothetical protein
MARVRRVRIIKKVLDATGSWKFVSLKRSGNRYVWDAQPGLYFLDWRDPIIRGKKTRGDCNWSLDLMQIGAAHPIVCAARTKKMCRASLFL